MSEKKFSEEEEQSFKNVVTLLKGILNEQNILGNFHLDEIKIKGYLECQKKNSMKILKTPLKL